MAPEINKLHHQKVTEEIAKAHRALAAKADRIFVWLLPAQWGMALLFAFFISPRTWSGANSETHIHIYAALFIGALLTIVPVFLVLRNPGAFVNRMVITVAQLLFSTLFIHLTGGRIETHFHIFGSLAFLAIYRDWRPIILATVITAADHFLRGEFFPESVYGVLSTQAWRFIKHAGWVVFEDIVLLYSVKLSLDEMTSVAEAHVELDEDRFAELEGQKKLFEAVIENIPVAIFLKNANDNFRITLWNKAAENIFEVSRADLLGKTTHELWPKEDADKYTQVDKKVIADGLLLDIAEETSPTKTRGQIILHTRKIPLRLVGRKGMDETYLLGICEDITLERAVQRELEQTIQSIEEAAIVGVADINGNIIRANKNFCDTSGYGHDELIGKNYRMLKSGYHSDAFFSDMWKTISSGMVWKGEIKNRSKAGSMYWAQAVISPIKDVAGIVQKYITVRFDVTAQKEAQKQLIQSSKMSSLGEMAGGIAHEINNPLAIIYGKAELLKKKLDAGPVDIEEFKAQLSKIELTAERIGKIIRGLRSFSRNSDSDPMEQTKLSQIIADTVELCKERFRNHSIDLSLNYDAETFIECRPAQIAQVLMNLLGNAFDAVENMGTKWVSLHVNTTENSVSISITDSGNGIPELVAEKLMQPFFTTKEVGKGTGLGLSISKGIAEEHHGSLYYDSNSINTRFVFELPKKQPNSQVLAEAA